MLSKDMEGLASSWTKAKYRKMRIEGRDPVNTETPHYGEAGAVNDGEILIAPGCAKIPGSLHVRQGNGLDYRDPGPQTFPKSFRGSASQPVMKQRPCFDQNMIGGDQCFGGP